MFNAIIAYLYLNVNISCTFTTSETPEVEKPLGYKTYYTHQLSINQGLEKVGIRKANPIFFKFEISLEIRY